MIEKDLRLISWRDPIDNMTLLHKAGIFNSYNCSQVLLHRGADPYSTIPNCEWTPIHLAARDSSQGSTDQNRLVPDRVVRSWP